MARRATPEQPFDVVEHTKRVVEALKRRDGYTNRALAARMNQEYGVTISENTLGTRLAATPGKTRPPFTHYELYALASIFKVPVAVFFRPVEYKPAEIVILTDGPDETGTNRNIGAYYGKSVLVSGQPGQSL